MQEFPPVVQYLFDRAFDGRSKKLRKATFSFDDVRKAIAATGSKLHWVREDTFLAELAGADGSPRFSLPCVRRASPSFP